MLIRYELLCLFLKLNTEVQFETQLCDPRISGNEWQTVSQLSVPSYVQGGSNMTGTDVARFTHKHSRSYVNHLVCKDDSCAWLGSVAS